MTVRVILLLSSLWLAGCSNSGWMQIQSETGYCYASSSIGGANVLDSFCRKVQEMSLKLVGPKCDPEQILVANASAVQRGTISDYQNAHSIEMNHERTCVDTL